MQCLNKKIIIIKAKVLLQIFLCGILIKKYFKLNYFLDGYSDPQAYGKKSLS